MTSPTEPTEPANPADPGPPDLDRIIDAAGLDSFPASDPPGWWAGTEPAPAPPQDEDDNSG